MGKTKLRVIPLGGLGEIGKNMMVFEFGDDMIIVDAGLMFPEEEMLGIDLVIPDITYVRERIDKLRGIIITHGHEDHIGALPFILPELQVPVYSSRLTNGLIRVKLKENKALDGVNLNIVQAGDEVHLGAFRVEFFRVCHSIPDALGLAIHTPVGLVIHSGDFKFDHTPVNGPPTDFAKLAEFGQRGVLLLLADSTYVDTPGYTESEQVVGDALRRLMMEAPGRVIVATFASLISRVQQVIDAAYVLDRRVCIVGRSMVDTVQMAMEMGYLTPPEGVLMRVDELGRLPPEQIVIVTTGSQGEPTSALARMANRDHRQIRIQPGDTVIMSATPIPGNEQLVNRTIDNLFKEGANVFYGRSSGVHVHGHASQEELKMLFSLLRPQYFMPIHGEYRHLALHARLAQRMGITPERISVSANGHVHEFSPTAGRMVGKVAAGYVFVDGLGVGDIGHVVLRDRQLLSRDGIFVVIVAMDKQTGQIVGRPDIVSRGFVYGRDSEQLFDMARDLVVETMDGGSEHILELSLVNRNVKDALSKFLYDQTKRRPMVLPVVMEV
ncbi:MAG: ribonuclease J [Chloroflexota bacterium]|nr:MAG: ribonuclease J [Chloroflexota bacterium]